MTSARRSILIVLEKNLLDELYNSNYSNLVRPSSTVLVNGSLMIYSINSVSWIDERLAWSSLSDYSAVQFLFNIAENTWVPPLYVENSVEDLSVINDDNLSMRISPDGTVNWTPPGVYKVSCECDITYYPLDKQTCNIKFTTAGYTQGEITLQFKANAVDMSAYVENGEWEIISAGGSSNGETTSTRGGNTYASLEFNFVLKRRHVFHVLNTIFPVVLMVLLIPLVFKLDLESGDKTGYSLTVLLSYAVYLTVIAEHIPSTSVSICFLSMYLAIILILCTLSVPFGILVVHVYNRTDEVSPFVNSISRNFLMKFFCKGESCRCCQRNILKVKPKVQNNTETNETQPSRRETDSLPNNAYDNEQENDITWKEIACLLDKLFFVVFTLIIAIISLIILMIIGVEYASY